MIRLRIPAKYQRLSLHVWCNECNKVVTAKPCSHVERQRYQSRVYNPLTQTVNCIKSHETREIEEAVKLHLAYRAELNANNYNVIVVEPVQKKAEQMFFFKDAAKMYIDWLQDINLPRHKRKNLTQEYIKEQQSYLSRIFAIIQKREGRIVTSQQSMFRTNTLLTSMRR